MHGFDEFFGNLYHLNAEEEPEDVDYPNAEGLSRVQEEVRAARRAALLGRRQGRPEDREHRPAHQEAHGDRATTSSSPRPRSSSRQPTDAGKPFFVWFNTTHMHFRTHAKPESKGQSGRWQSEYHDVMIDHDKHIGEMLDFLDELGIADNTFVSTAPTTART